jgi:hypothetical protein
MQEDGQQMAEHGRILFILGRMKQVGQAAAESRPVVELVAIGSAARYGSIAAAGSLLGVTRIV